MLTGSVARTGRCASTVVTSLVAVLALLAGPAPSAAAQPAIADVPAAVVAVGAGEQSHIVAVDEDGTVRALTGGAHDVGPVPAPGGDRVAFLRLAEPGADSGELGLVDLASADVELTGIPVDRGVPLLWQDPETLVSSTEHGIVRIHLPSRSVAFVPGTAARQVALAIRPDGGAILAWRHRPSPDAPILDLIELRRDGELSVLWTGSEYTIAAGAYDGVGGIAFVTSVSTSGFGTQQTLHFRDAEGDVRRDSHYGFDGGLHLEAGPFWHPAGGSVLLSGVGSTRFPGQEVEPPRVFTQGPGTERDRSVATRPVGHRLLALGWRPDASALVVVEDAPDANAALLLLLGDGRVLRRVELPGDLSGRWDARRLGVPAASLVPALRRVAGPARGDTAAQVSQETFPASVGTSGPLAEQVVLARRDIYADALTGAPLARHLGGPLLLTGRSSLDDAAAREIERLGATEAVLLGGEAALEPEVAAELERRGLTVRRVAGRDRFATAAAVAQELPDADRVVLVQGLDTDPQRGWPDAVSAAPLAAATGSPLLLTLRDRLPDATADALRALSPATVTVVGGATAVSDAVAQAAADAAGAAPRRLAGATRTGTAVAVAEAQIAEGSGSAASLWLATAQNWPDALTAGPAVAAHGGVLVLAPARPAESELAGFLRATRSRVARLVGGPSVLGGGELLSLLRGAGLGVPVPAPIDV